MRPVVRALIITFFTDGNLFVIHKICTQFSTSAERGAVGGRGACSRNIISLALQTPRVGTHTTNTRLEKILEQTHPWHPTSAGNFRHIYHLLFCTRPLKCSAKMILPLKLVLIFTRPILGGREFLIRNSTWLRSDYFDQIEDGPM